MKKLNRVLALVLTLCMLLTLVPTAFAAETKTGITAETNLSAPSVELHNAVNNAEAEPAVNADVTVEKIENPNKDLKPDVESDVQTEALGYDAENVVTVIVVMEEDSLLDQGYSKKQIAGNASAIQAAREALEQKQRALLTDISALTGSEVAAGYSYCVIISGFSVDVPYGKLSEIQAMEGVRAAFVAPVFAVPEDMTPNSTGVSTNMYATSESFGSALTWQNAGYTGAGMRVAILDTGLDTDHPSFVDAPELTETSLTAEETAGVIANTNAAARYNYVYGMDLTAEKVYRSEKIPFGFNYGSNSLDVTHDNDDVGDHGTHVAGIAAANAIDTTEVVGVAPDVTAPGGNIYSSVDNGQYGIMSGTSMSAPHIAGMAALVLQYLHETHPELTDAQMHTVAEALIMSTATPAVDYSNEVVYPDGIEYSPRKQGSGVANVYDAVTSGSYLTVNGSTPKVSMGDNDTKSGNFTFSFEINNFSDQTQSYALSGSAMTDFVDTSYSAYGYLFMGETAYALRAVPTFYIREGNVDTVYDVNGDEVCNLDDVQALLDIIVGLTEVPDCVGFDVDFDDNGVVDTADAQLLYELITSGMTESDMVVVEPGETVSVNVELQLTEWDMAYMETFYENGIYVDGFVRLSSLNENGVDLSLPFVGFYGDWSAARVYDGGWYYQTEEELEVNRYVNVLWTDYGTSMPPTLWASISLASTPKAPSSL